MSETTPKALPFWHPAVVPGIEWSRYYREQRRKMANGAAGPEPLEKLSPDARFVDPPKYRD